MSIKWMNTVWNKSHCSGNELLTLMAIADEADDHGVSRSDIPSLCRKTRMADKRCVIRVIHRIEAAGELGVLRREGLRSVYTILIDRTVEDVARILASIPTPLQKDTRDKLSQVTKSHTGQTVTRDKESSRVLRTESYDSESSIELKNPPQSSIAIDDDDDVSKILKAAGVWKRDRQALREKQIPLADILAELARCHADGAVRKPARIMPMNLLRGDTAGADWYTDQKLTRYLPEPVLTLARPDLVSVTSEFDSLPLDSGYANETPEPEPVEEPEIWQSIKMLLQPEMSPGTYQTYLLTASAVFDNDTLTITTPAVEWLSGRLTSTITRLAAGCAGKPVHIQFIATSL